MKNKVNLRFEVVCHALAYNKYIYWVRDNDFQQYYMPERACTLYFSEEKPAQIIADLLNAEWINS